MWHRVVEAAPVEVRETPNCLVGAVVGASYLLAGVVAFAITAGSHLAVSPGHHADGLGGLHCTTYVLVGLCLLVGVVTGRARRTNSAVGMGYLVVGIALLFSDSEAQLLTLHETDNLLQLASAALLVGFGQTQE